MALKIPKKLLEKHGYVKAVGMGKWFKIGEAEIKIKLAYVKESKYFKTNIEDITEKAKKLKNETNVENGERALKLWTDFLCKSIVLDWNLEDDQTNKKADLNPETLFELLEGYPDLVTEIFQICSDNKRFLKDVDGKK